MILSLDGASTDLSLALAHPDGQPIDDFAWTSAQRQSAEILPRLLELLERNGRNLREASAVAVGTGPGSFTGLRVAMALAKGLSTGLGCPVVGVPSLEAWLEAEPEAQVALARAGSREAYLATRDVAELAVVALDDLPPQVTVSPVVAPSELASAFGLAGARRPRGATAIARRAAARLRKDAAGDDLAALEPLYLRAPRGITAEPEGRVRWL